MTVKKKILLTGGSGFIGRNIIEQLGGKHSIFAPSASKIDLTDEKAIKKLFKKREFDIIIHAANIGIYEADQKSGKVATANIRMFFNLAQNLSKKQRMIFLGSGAEYDKRSNITSVTEREFGRSIPVDDYGFAKYVCSKYLETASNIINLRCFGIYGKYEQRTRFISSAIINTLEHKPISIRQNVYFDYLYIDDLIKIIDYFISHKPKHTSYNVASGIRVDLVTLSNIVKTVTGYHGEILIEKNGLSKEYTANINRLKKEIALSPTSFEEGIGILANYYKTQGI